MIIRRSIEDHKPLPHIDIQHLLYFWHGWMLAIHDEPLHYGQWEAWRYGPVLPEVYYQLNWGRGKPIDDLIHTPDVIFTEDEKNILETVYDYRRLGSFGLAGVTHSKEGPWHRAWHYGNPKDYTIYNETLQAYFKKILQKHESEQ